MHIVIACFIFVFFFCAIISSMTAITPCWPTRTTHPEIWAQTCRPRRAVVRIWPTCSAWSAWSAAAVAYTDSVARSSLSSTTTVPPPTAVAKCLHRRHRLRFPSWDATTFAAARCRPSHANRNLTATASVHRPPDTTTITSYCTTIITIISAVATGRLRNRPRRHRRPGTWRLTAAVAFTSHPRPPPTWWSGRNGNKPRWTCATDVVWKSSTVTTCSRSTRDGTLRVCSVPNAPGPWPPKLNVFTGTATYTAKPTTKGEPHVLFIL